MACGFHGDPDIYGIGIRIGYYTQALALWVANFFVLREAKTLRGVNNIFVFALGVAGSIYAYNARNTYAVEAFLLLQIAICIGVSSVMDYARYSSRYLQRSEQRLLLRTITINTGLVFNLCFWWRGLDVMKPTPCTNSEERGTYAFYFAKVNLYGWMRIVMKIAAVVALVNYLSTSTCRDLTEVIQNLKLQEIRREFVRAVDILESSAVRPHKTYSFPKIEDLSAVNKAILGIPAIISTRSFSPMNAPPQESNTVDTILPTQTPATTPATTDPPPDLGSPTATINTRPPVEPLTPNPPDLLLKVAQASTYLKLIFFTSPLSPIDTSNPPYSHHRPTADTLPLLHSLAAIIRMSLANRPSANVRYRISFHATSCGRYTPTQTYNFLARMHLLHLHNPSCRIPEWRHLALASDIALAQIPLTITAKSWVFEAVNKMLVLLVLIVQVEMTIRWNHIDDLKTLRSLGQLIPFILGVGGLVKVLWVKMVMVWKGRKEETEDERMRKKGEYERAVEKYIELTRAKEQATKWNPSSAVDQTARGESQV
ncbi:MAG: hypothetical protein LQ352_007777 [Teloschistes flavicans]|nr:MAG: hypothetical protein LQ352_007777 [Teloschistes flavicans]